MFGTALGVGIVLSLLLVAAQVLTHLYATSVVEAAAYDAVRAVSGEAAADTMTAEAHARDLLGDMAEHADFEWTLGADEVVLRVVAERRPIVAAWGGRLAPPDIEREFRMRVERFR